MPLETDAYCRKCDAPLTREAKVCPKCGRKLDAGAPWWGAPLVIVILILIVVSLAMVEEYEFNHMNPAQHLAAAKKAQADGERELSNVSLKVSQDFREGALEGGLRHISAIPANSAEKAEATGIAEQLEIRLQELRDAKERALQAKSDQIVAVEQLGVELRNLGYELNLSRSSQEPNEIVITSKDFADTDRRVRFLSFLRNSNGGHSGFLCSRGVQMVRLKTSLPVLGFNEQYSLNCFGSQ